MRLQLVFEVGETTCASEPGVFCRFLRSNIGGEEWRCDLFKERVFEHSDGERIGWLARLPECMALPVVK